MIEHKKMTEKCFSSKMYKYKENQNCIVTPSKYTFWKLGLVLFDLKKFCSQQKSDHRYYYHNSAQLVRDSIEYIFSLFYILCPGSKWKFMVSKILPAGASKLIYFKHLFDYPELTAWSTLLSIHCWWQRNV